MALSINAADYLDFLDLWLQHLPAAKLSQMIGDPHQAVVLCVDVINGFCTTGPLASARVEGIVPPITHLFRLAYGLGIRYYLLPQDTHDPQALEFATYPPHCLRGDVQSETAPELLQLPFAGRFVIIEKNSISSSENTALDGWVVQHPQVNTFIVTGDCTDLCTYQLALHLRLRANARQLAGVRVIVPADCVQTFDTPMYVAKQLGIPPHPADVLNAVFLHSMASNGVEIYSHLE